jgi:uncharacterized protein (DUF934 family)
MQKIIKDGAIVADDWVRLSLNEDGTVSNVPQDGDVIVPLAAWLADAARWQARQGRTAVWLAPDDDPALLAATLGRLALVAVDFPAFADGRGYSIGRLLRERYNYRGELRALGDVGQDQLHYLWQVGFNAFEIKPTQNIELALQALARFSDRYQSTFREPEPLFRRRVTGG